MQRKYVNKRYVVEMVTAPVTQIQFFYVYDKHCEVFILDNKKKEYTSYYAAQLACDRLNMESKAYDKVLFKYLTKEIP